MELHDIKEVPDLILNKLDLLTDRDCQAGRFSLTQIRETSRNTDILYLLEADEPVYFLLLDRFPKHKSVYIHDVCVSKSQRGRGLFKKSLGFLKGHYAKKGFNELSLDASDSVEEGLDQKARIHIFHSAGFEINPESGYFRESGEYEVIDTSVLLTNGTRVVIQRREGSVYIVKNSRGTSSTIQIGEIERCFDSDSNPISCPMIMSLPKNGGRSRKTRRRRK